MSNDITNGARFSHQHKEKMKLFNFRMLQEGSEAHSAAYFYGV